MTLAEALRIAKERVRPTPEGGLTVYCGQERAWADGGRWKATKARACRAYVAIAVLGGNFPQCSDAERYGNAWDVRSAVTFVCYRAAMIGMGAKP